jgi:hypothetical protein
MTLLVIICFRLIFNILEFTDIRMDLVSPASHRFSDYRWICIFWMFWKFLRIFLMEQELIREEVCVMYVYMYITVCVCIWWSPEQIFHGSIFWDITSCSPLKANRRFGRTCRLHLHGESRWQVPLWGGYSSLRSMIQEALDLPSASR